MNWLYVTIVIVIIVAAAVKLLAQLRIRANDSTLPYAKAVLFSPAERSFLGVLDQAVSDRFRVFGKVRVADVLEVRDAANASERARAFNKISAKHFDFILCDPNDLTVVAAIELDDSSHQRNTRQTRDEFLKNACAAAGVRLVRFPARRAYAVAECRTTILDALSLTAGTSIPGRRLQPSIEEPQAPSCPKCASAMVRREGKTGPLAGTIFWGCATYPKCRGMIPITASAESAP